MNAGRLTHTKVRLLKQAGFSSLAILFQNGWGGGCGGGGGEFAPGGGGKFFPLIEAPHGIKTSDITTLGDFH